MQRRHQVAFADASVHGLRRKVPLCFVHRKLLTISSDWFQPASIVGLYSLASVHRHRDLDCLVAHLNIVIVCRFTTSACRQ